jgi:cobalamin synthase
VRLGVDVGLLVIVLSSMAIRQPFTLQYAKESVPKEHWGEPKFIETNNKLTSVWAAAFAAIVVADASMFFVPSIPMAFGIAVTVAALLAARYTSKITG